MMETVAMEENPRRRWKDYVDKLEEERRKIEVFRRELPLCLDLVTQTIVSYRQQMRSNEGSVLEEFVPVRGASTGEMEDGGQGGGRSAVESEKEEGEGKVNWLRSVQLASQAHDENQRNQKVQVWKPKALDGRRGCGAFQAFFRENCRAEKEVETAAVPPTTPSPPPPPPPPQQDQRQEPIAAIAESSTAETGGGEGCGSSGQESKEEQKKGQSRRKMRRCWSPELHRRFLDALQQLGGAHSATPKQIREHMKVEGLTGDEVKSHLQKYRLHTGRPNTATPSNAGGHQTPRFVLVGGIWVPPPGYAAAMVAAPPPRDGNGAPDASKAMYTPMGALIPSQPNHNQVKQRTTRSTFTTVPLHQARGPAGSNKNSGSPATSSSSRSTSTSSHS